jgi:lantibiotic transport system permease protein
MIATFASSVRSEWLKTRRSLMTPLVLGAALFTPVIILFVRLMRRHQLPAIYGASDFWQRLWIMSWESMAILILPLSISLAVSLMAQIEYRNNTWKQLHASPQPLATIYLAKLTVIVAMVLQLFIWFHVAMYVTAMIPVLLPGVDAPASPIPLAHLLRRTASLFVDILPIVGLQYLLALRCRSFVMPLAIAVALWILALASLGWEFNYLFPYGYATIDYTTEVRSRVSHALPASTRVLALGCFVAFTLAGYVLYVRQQDRG